MSAVKQTLYIISSIALILMFAFLTLFVNTHTEAFLVIGLIAFCVCYHVVSRLVIGYICERAFSEGVNYNSERYAVAEFEENFYRKLNFRKLKKKIPSIEETDFSIKKQSIEDIIALTCEAEVRHEFCMIASFLPMLLTLLFGYIPLFLITSAAGIIWDLGFALMQRYNRPRLMRTAEKQRERFFEKLREENEDTAEPAENGDADNEV